MRKYALVILLFISVFIFYGCQDANNYYTVTYMSNGGTTVLPSYGEKGTPIKAPANPEKLNFSFLGWYYDNEFTNKVNFPFDLNEDTILYAKWETNENVVYEITWIVNDKTYQTYVNHGEFPTYTGDTITKESSEMHHYEFSGWTPSIQVATSDVTYTAQFNEIDRYYQVTFIVDQNQYTEFYRFGEIPVFNGVPTKQPSAQYIYAFSRWDKNISPVASDQIYVAQFSSTPNEHTITWNINGLLSQETYQYGELPTYKGSTPKKNDTTLYSYIFEGWDYLVVPVTENATYTAVFTQTDRYYKVEWRNYNGVLLEVDYMSYNEFPKYNSSEPLKSMSSQFYYNFSGWSPSIEMVTGDTTYTATFSETVRVYDINFIVDNHITTIQYTYGSLPVYDSPEKNGDLQYSYEFSHWSPTFTNVVGNATYTAIFDLRINEYMVSFDTQGGSTIVSQSKPYGSFLMKPDDPVYDGYLFDGWYSDNTYKNIWNFGENRVDGVTQTIYAKWVKEYEYQLVSNGLFITKYNAKQDTDVIVPSEIDGITVRGISDYAFRDHTEILTLGFESPENIEYIGIGAFSGNSSLNAIELPFIGNSLTSLGEEALLGYIFGHEYFPLSVKVKQYYTNDSFIDYYVPFTLKSINILGDNDLQFGAFSNIHMVNSLSLNEGVKVVSPKAFMGMNSLKSLELPSSVTLLSDSALHGLSYLEYLKVPLNDSDIRSAFGQQIYTNSYSSDAFYIPYNLSEIEIINADTVTNDAFKLMSGIKKLTLPDSITSIAANSFYGMSSLEYLSIPFVGLSRTSTAAQAYLGILFGSGTYQNSYSANGYYLPNGLTEVNITDTIRIGTNAFNDANKIEKINLPEQLITIESYAFRGTKNITSIELPETLETIGEYAFANMTSLVSLEIPLSVVSIGANAFANTTSLISLSIPFVGQSREATGANAYLGYSFGTISYVNTYYANGYYLPVSLKSITVTDATRISSYAFSGSTNITDVFINEEISIIHDYAFYQSGLENISLHEGITYIGSYAFHGTKINQITLPSTLSTLNPNSFSQTSLLERVVFSENISISTISSYAFAYTPLLSEISLPEGITSIQYYAFYQSGLLDILVPNSVTHIGEYALSGMANLEFIYFNEESMLSEIGNYAFADNYMLKELSIPNDTVTIGNYAFRNNNLVETLHIPTSVTTVGQSALYGMSNLKSITLPFTGFSRIATSTSAYFGFIFGTSPYTNSYSAAGYYLPNGLTHVSITDTTTIATNAFYNATSIVNLEIPDTVTTMGSSSLRGMSGLKSLNIPYLGNTRGSTGTSAYLGYIFGTVSYTGSYLANGFYIPKGLEELRINDANTILQNSLSNINSVKILYINNEVSVIYGSSLVGMYNLEELSIPFVGNSREATGTAAYLGYIFGPISYTNSYSANGYFLPLSLSTVIVNDTNRIGDNAFYGTSSLTSISLPNTLLTIGVSAFEKATNLSSIIIPISVTFVGGNAFEGALSITIYAEIASKPTGWSTSWNPNNRQVVWNYVA